MSRVIDRLSFIEPQLLTFVDHPPQGSEWMRLSTTSYRKLRNQMVVTMKHLLTLLACVFLFTGCASAADLMAGPRKWQIRFSPSMPAHPSASGSGWAFDFPQGSPCGDEKCPAVHYVTRPYGKTITDGATLTATFRVDANAPPTFGYKTQKESTCVAPATVRFILQKKNDDFYAVNGALLEQSNLDAASRRRFYDDREA